MFINFIKNTRKITNRPSYYFLIITKFAPRSKMEFIKNPFGTNSTKKAY